MKSRYAARQPSNLFHLTQGCARPRRACPGLCSGGPVGAFAASRQWTLWTRWTLWTAPAAYRQTSLASVQCRHFSAGTRPSPLAPRPSPLAPRPSPLAPRPSPLAPRPSPLAPRPSPLAPRPSPLAPRPSPLAPRPSPLAPRPSPLAPRPSPLAPRPSPLAPRPSPLAPRPSPLAPCPSPLAPKKKPVQSDDRTGFFIGRDFCWRPGRDFRLVTPGSCLQSRLGRGRQRLLGRQSHHTIGFHFCRSRSGSCRVRGFFSRQGRCRCRG
jgi:hypothetical protein